MRIISLNLNGIRSAANKGFFTWMLAQNADIVCVQELKAQAADMAPDMLAPRGYHGYQARQPALRHRRRAGVHRALARHAGAYQALEGLLRFDGTGQGD